VLNNLRDSLRPHLEKLGKSFASTGISPNGWSCIGLTFAFVSAFIYGWNIEFSLIIGGILLLVAGFFDIVDGQVARVSQKITKSGGFLDSAFDKIAEVAVFLGILVGGFAEPYLVFLAITFSLLVSFTRAKAESLGVNLQGVGIGERAERLLVIAIIGIIGFMEYAIIIDNNCSHHIHSKDCCYCKSIKRIENSTKLTILLVYHVYFLDFCIMRLRFSSVCIKSVIIFLVQ